MARPCSASLLLGAAAVALVLQDLCVADLNSGVG
ncbi:hypothetical protein ACP4OV_013729 [Aristida adscensionis]